MWTARWTYLEGSLNLNDFINLEQLYCDRGELTSLDVSNCSKLTHIHCEKNYHLTNDSLSLPKNGENLIVLDISINKLTDLSIIDKYINLRRLHLGNNAFVGNLKYLRKFKKLSTLDIRESEGDLNYGPYIRNNNKFDASPEYLPPSLKRLYCTGQLAEELKNYERMDSLDNVYYDYQSWRKDHSELIRWAEKDEEMREWETILTNLHLALVNQILPQLTDQAFQIFIFQGEEKIKELKKELEEIKEGKLATKIEVLPK